MRLGRLIALLAERQTEAAAKAARQRAREQIFPTLAHVRLEDRRLLNAAPVAVAAAHPIKDEAAAAPKADAGAAHNGAGGDVSRLAETMYRGPANGEMTAEMRGAVHHAPAGKSVDGKPLGDQQSNASSAPGAAPTNNSQNAPAAANQSNTQLFIAAGAGTDSASLSGQSVNSPPVNTLPGPQTTNEDTPLVIMGISVADADSDPSPIVTRFQVTSGTLAVDTSMAGTTIQPDGTVLLGNGATVLGNGTSIVQIIGTVEQINGALSAGLTYAPNADFNGADTLTMVTNDLGAFGSGGPMQDTDTVGITVLPVNDPPVNTVPGPQTTNEDTPLVITGLSVSDVDSDPSPIVTRFQITNGTLTVDDSIAGVVVVGNGTNIVQIIGTVEQINATLALPKGVTYTPNANYNGADTLTMVTNDLGAFGSGGPMQDTDTVGITVLPVNDAPVNTVPGPQTTNEDTPLVITGLSVSDVDSDPSPIVTRFQVTNGTLTVDDSIAGVVVVGNGTNIVQIIGTVEQINATLALPTGLTYTPNANYNGADTLTMVTNDLGAFGSGGPMQDTDTVGITVLAVNDAPVNTVPGSQTTNEDTPLVITGLSVSDVDSDPSPIVTRFQVTNGTLTVDDSIAGVVVIGNGTNIVQIIGSVEQINATLALPTGLTYTPNANYNGADTLTMVTNDLGAFGSGGPMQDTDTVGITVLPVNDAPVNTVPGPQTTNEDTPLVITGLSVSDVDSDPSPIVTRFQVTNGTLTVDDSIAGVVVVGNGTNIVQIIGTVEQINATLALPTGLTYTPNANYNGADTLTMVTNDLGAFGSGGPLQDTDTVGITVLPVNDAPVNTVPGPQTTNEDTSLIITGLSVSDVDAGSSQIVTEFSVAHGTLTVDTSVPGVTVTGNGTSDVQIHGTVAQINATLALATGLKYTPALNYNGPDTLTMVTNDLGATGSGGPLQDTDTVGITVLPVNDPPVNTVPGPQTTNEDTPLVITGLSVSDVDSDPSPIVTRFQVTNGTLTVDDSIAGVVVVGNGTNIVQIIGTVEQINSTLALPTGLTYTPNANYNGADTLTMVTNDLGAFGSGGPLQDTDTVGITILPVNDAPVNTVPGPQTTNEDTPLVITGLSVSDVDSDPSPIVTRFQVTNGTLTVDDSIAGVVVVGNGTNIVQIIGTVEQINATLALPTGLTYTPNANYNGADTLTMVTNDLGATGAGGPLQDTDTVGITILPVNDAPVNTVPGPQTTNEDTSLIITGLSVSDVDAGSSQIVTEFSVAHGTLTVDTSVPGVTVSGNGTNDVQIHGTVAQINATLALATGLKYTPALNYNGPDVLTMVTNDLGATGSGGPMTDTDTVGITVLPVNDAPVNTVPGPQTTNEDTPLVITGLSVSDVDSDPSPIVSRFQVTNGTLTIDTSMPGTTTQPDGTVLLGNGAIVLGNGTSVVQIIGTVEQINEALQPGLTYLSVLNYSGPDTLTVVTNDLGATGAGGPLQDTDTVAITVIPVADKPTLTLGSPAVSGFEGTQIPLNISGQLYDTDGSEVLTFTISNVPTIGVLHDGLGVDHTGQSSYTFSAAQIAGMTLLMPDDTGFNNFNLTVAAIATEQANGDMAQTVGLLNVTIVNANPVLSNLHATDTNEGSATTLTGVISDLGTDTFTVTVTWGDGTQSVYTGLDRGAFSFTHVYADDNPTGTPSDITPIHVAVVDDDGGPTSGDTTLTVFDVAPSITNISTVPILESQTTTLKFTVSDPGTDSFHITVDWGDGSSPTVINAPQAGDFTLNHTYLDDGPTHNPVDFTPITITAVDDDTLSTTVKTTVEVDNVAPTITGLSITPTVINESNSATLTGTFTDPGVLDTFTLAINWGDQTPVQIINMPAGSNSFSVTHFYADDNPSGTFGDLNKVVVTVTDDDTGVGTAFTNIQVNDVSPTLTNLVGSDVGSNGIATLSGTVNDVGLQDTLTLTINWGDTVQVINNVPRGNFTISHFYDAPPDPSNPSAPITIQVRVADDDSGAVTNQHTSAVPGLGPNGGALALFYVLPPPTPPQLFESGGGHADLGNIQPLALSFTTVQFDPRTPQLDALTAVKPVVALRTVDAATESEKDAVLLPVDVLNNLPNLFAKLPDDHYRLYYVEQGTERLIMDVVVRHGKPIDPSDDSEGTLDRPPTSQQEIQPDGADPFGPAGDGAPQVQGAPAGDVPRGVPQAEASVPQAALPATPRLDPLLPELIPSALEFTAAEGDTAQVASAAPGFEPIAAIERAASRLAVPAAEQAAERQTGVAGTSKYRQLLAPAAAAVVASSVWSSGRWAQKIDEELARSPDDALGKAARLKRRLRRQADDATPRRRAR